MSATLDEQGGRFDLQSSDETRLAVWIDGKGPPIVLVHGSLGDHTAWTVPVGVLRRRMTTFALDRRGFGASDDSPSYAIDRDFEDVAAVVDSVARRSGSAVVVWGHSYGANCAMGGATLTGNVSHLVLYEPSLGLVYPPGAVEAVEDALASGDREAAIGRVLFDVLEMEQEEIDALRSSPRWENLIAGAHTAPRECRAEQNWVYREGQFDGIGARTLLLSGSESPPAVRELTRRAADAIPNSRIEVLEGHGHFAHRTDPELVVDIIQRFIAE